VAVSPPLPALDRPTHLLDLSRAKTGNLQDGQTKLLQQPKNMRRWERRKREGLLQRGYPKMVKEGLL